MDKLSIFELVIGALLGGGMAVISWMLNHYFSNLTKRLDDQDEVLSMLSDRLAKRFEDCVKHFATHSDISMLQQNLNSVAGNMSCGPPMGNVRK